MARARALRSNNRDERSVIIIIVVVVVIRIIIIMMLKWGRASAGNASTTILKWERSSFF